MSAKVSKSYRLSSLAAYDLKRLSAETGLTETEIVEWGVSVANMVFLSTGYDTDDNFLCFSVVDKLRSLSRLISAK